MKFDLSEEKVRELSRRAAQLTDCISQHFPPQIDGKEIRKIYLEDIEEFKRSNNVEVYWDDFEETGGEGVDGVEYVIELDEPIGDCKTICVICINRKVDALKGPAKGRAFKEAFLHEISHLILNHPGALVHLQEPVKDTDILSSMLWSYEHFFANEKKRDQDAELMATILGFWPTSEFTRLFKRTRADLRSIANEYKMTVDSAAQWAIIQFHEVLKIHYLRRQESDKVILSQYGVDPGFDVFEIPGTAAFKASKEKQDSKSDVRDGKYECSAYFEKQEYFPDCNSDQVVVVGFLLNQVFKSFMLLEEWHEVQDAVAT